MRQVPLTSALNQDANGQDQQLDAQNQSQFDSEVPPVADRMQSRDMEFNPRDEQSGGDEGGASGVASLGQGPAQSQAQGQDWESIMDVAAQYGYDTSQYSDDRQLLHALITNANTRQQEDFYSRLGRAIEPHQQKFQNYLQQGQQQAQPQGPKAWEAPKFDRAMLGMVDYIPQANIYIGKPGTSPQIVDSVNAFHKWNEQFTSNPTAVLEPWAKEQIPQLVEQQVTQRMEAWQRQQSFAAITQRNADWMYAKDATGNFLNGQNGYVPTPNGVRYGRYVQQLERSGMRNPEMIDQFARAQLMADLGYSQQQQQNNQSPQNQRNNALAASRTQQNTRQSRSPLERPANEPAAEREHMSLEDRLRSDLADFPEADFTMDNARA